MSSTSCYESVHVEWNHGVSQWLGVEGALKITQFQPPAMGRDATPYQVAQGPIQYIQ